MPPEAAPYAETWPSLPLEAWRETYATLQLWTQVVGKVRLVQAPFQNHWWHSVLYVTARGLTTSPMPHGERTFQIDFDFTAHALRIDTGGGETRVFPLRPYSVAEFYGRVMDALRDLGLPVQIDTLPQEVENPIPFEQDQVHASYDPEYAARCWRILAQTDRVLQRFRSDFLGKSSPVHFFWGSFDLAQTRFSGRPAPPHPGGIPGLADWVTREAYSHEVSSCGFWPGGGPVPEPVFYAYAYPEPPGYSDHRPQPEAAFYSPQMREFLLPYEAVRQSPDPDGMLLAFCRSTYEAAAELGGWDRAALERQGGIPHAPA
ncbi:MAG TPA: DUF5996 family protein [Armatimonadota bacterium]|nr:DUF5996 family protein [Armatimonadota bacterium]